MKVAAYNGILSSNLIKIPTPPFSCTSGNCTWDPFSTLAISTQCINLTDHVSLNCSMTSQNCNFVAINDSVLTQMLNGSTSDDGFIIKAGPGTSSVDVLKSYANMTSYLSSVQWVKALGMKNSGVTLYEGINANTSFEAGRCSFYFSVIEVQAQVVNGVYSEQVLREYTDIQYRSAKPYDTVNGTEFFFMDPYAYDFSQTLVFKAPFAEASPNKNNTFTLSFEYFEQLGSLLWFSSFLNGKVYVGITSGEEGSAVGGAIDDDVLLLYQADNVTRAMYNLAQYMTTEVRAYSSTPLGEAENNATAIDAQQAIIGTVWTQKQFVTVEWAWLTLPAILLILTLLFFIGMCLKTRAAHVGLWASSPLALFFHGKVSEEMNTLRLNELDTAERMKAGAASIWAQINDNVHGGIEVYRYVHPE
jgi:hypothetical protein